MLLCDCVQLLQPLPLALPCDLPTPGLSPSLISGTEERPIGCPERIICKVYDSDDFSDNLVGKGEVYLDEHELQDGVPLPIYLALGDSGAPSTGGLWLEVTHSDMSRD